MVINATRPTDGRTHVQINIRLVGQVDQTDYMTLQFYNIVVRKCLESLKLEEMGRHFFDKSAAIVLPELRLELWPGYITSIRNHEKDVLLCVEPIHKVLRMDSVLKVIKDRQLSGPRNNSNPRGYQVKILFCVSCRSIPYRSYDISELIYHNNMKRCIISLSSY